jgi:phospholipase/carboxylesterase
MRHPATLVARPHATDVHPTQPGIHALDSGSGLIYVPAAYRVEQPAALVVMLHGAGGDAQQSIRLLRHAADADGVLVLAPRSKGLTWDAVRGAFGPDVHALDAQLAEVFERYAVDAGRVALAGFSDGASYALSLGLPNGDLFGSIIAFSPGFMVEAPTGKKPRVYVSHGTGDDVLNIQLCSRVLVPRLRARGYALHYDEFGGGHALPAEIARAAFRWFLD